MTSHLPYNATRLACGLACMLAFSNAATSQRLLPERQAVALNTQAASFQGLGDLPGGAKQSFARGISPDGSTIVGSSLTGRGQEAFAWTDATGMQGIGDLTGGSFMSEAKAVSAYGTVIVGHGTGFTGERGFRYTDAGGMQPLGDLPGGAPFSAAMDVSAAGDRIVGYSSSANGLEGFLHTAAAGMVGLGDLTGGLFASRALTISPYGNRIAGDGTDSQGGAGCYWDVGSAPIGLPGLGGLSPFAAIGASNDGNVLVGTSTGPGLPPEAFRWNGSATQNLGLIPYQTLTALGTNATGNRIVGAGFDDDRTRAWIWDPENGVRDLQDTLELEYGIDVARWQLEAATDISGDGQIIIGYGRNPNGDREAFVAVIPILCRGDLNNDGVIDLVDLGIFSQAYAQGAPRADFNGDGFVNLADVGAFVEAYNTGC